MKNLIIIAIALGFIAGCEPDHVGYFDLSHAMYIPDSVSFKAGLNPEDPDDAYRIEFEIPFQSPRLEGIDDDCFPVEYRIVRIECDDINREAAKQFYISNVSGVLELKYNHTVPAGLYVFTIEVSNENGKNRGVLEQCLKISVVENEVQTIYE